MQKNTSNYYKQLSEGFKWMEGEMLQNLYFYFKSLELTSDERLEGIPIPKIEELENIREDLSAIMMKRHDLFIREDLYKERWLE